MSELIDNTRKRREILKHMILQLHQGEAPEAVKTQLVRLLGQVPYGDVVEVEQELISEGLPTEEVLKLCDIHTAALKGTLDHTGAQTAPPGHPIHTFSQENQALRWEVASLENLYAELEKPSEGDDSAELLMKVKGHFHNLMDVDKHYQRKEYLLFPFLERHNVTGPPKVMWGKHDEARGLLKKALEALEMTGPKKPSEWSMLIHDALRSASQAIEEMIYKEEEILFPMSLEALTDEEWYSIYKGSDEIGYCLFDPTAVWKPEGLVQERKSEVDPEKIQFPSGNFTVTELMAILNTIPFDLTFVDKDDTVRYFTQGTDRIFARTRAIIGRKVQLCHPPSSVHIVQQILDDFRAGRQDRAAFWINMGGRFIHIEYIALRDGQKEYLGTIEVSQDLTGKRQLDGERRLLNYES